MFEVKLKMNGRELRAGDLGRELTRQIEAEAKRQLKQRADRIRLRRCPTHGTAPTVQPTRDGFSISACCESFKETIQREMSK